MSASLSPTPEQRLHQIFARLFDLSTQQMDALDNENYDKLANLLSEKDEVLRELKTIDQESEGVNEILNMAARNGGQEAIGLRELVRRYQAHEKYIIRQIQLRMNSIGDKLRGIRLKKSAASGYHSGSTEVSKFDLSS